MGIHSLTSSSLGDIHALYTAKNNYVKSAILDGK